MPILVSRRSSKVVADRSGPRARWVRRRHFIDTAGNIRPVRGAAADPYNPMSCLGDKDRPLHLELAAVDVQDPRALEDFASTWGLLGADQTGQSVAEFRQAAEGFRTAFEVATHMADGLMNDEDGNFLQGVFAEQLLGVQPVPGFRAERGEAAKVTAWTLDWQLPSLLAAAHLLLFLDLTAGRRPRLCANEKCGRPFIADRSDKLYCSARCSDQQKQRAIRRRADELENGRQTAA